MLGVSSCIIERCQVDCVAFVPLGEGDNRSGTIQMGPGTGTVADRDLGGEEEDQYCSAFAGFILCILCWGQFAEVCYCGSLAR